MLRTHVLTYSRTIHERLQALGQVINRNLFLLSSAAQGLQAGLAAG
jgi:hypothetical protein